MYCQSEIEGREICDTQCQHCKEYYQLLERNQMKQKNALVLGGHGFVGHHLARRLKQEGYWVRTVDIKEYEYGSYDFCDEHVIGDLRDKRLVEAVVRLDINDKQYSYFPRPFEESGEFDEIYCFACLMGGAAFVFSKTFDAEIMSDSALININVAQVLAENEYKGKLFYSSSACIYPSQIQESVDNRGLRESDAWPANPDSVYGLEKIFSESLYDAFARNHKLDIRIARFHNIYGEEGTYRADKNGVDKSKAPAAMCRKAIRVALDYMEGGDRDFIPRLNIWGDGEQTRSFLYISDCVDAVRLLMQSNFKLPINIGSEEMVSINQLAKIAIGLSGYEIEIEHDLNNKALGVRGRNSNNDLIRKELNWEPKYTLQQGMEKTFGWIKDQITQ